MARRARQSIVVGQIVNTRSNIYHPKSERIKKEGACWNRGRLWRQDLTLVVDSCHSCKETVGLDEGSTLFRQSIDHFYTYECLHAVTA